jgi:membrane protein DedA with SNARE-associated domain
MPGGPTWLIVVPPLAGVFGVSRLQFALYDVAGSVLWAGFWTGVGYELILYCS